MEGGRGDETAHKTRMDTLKEEGGVGEEAGLYTHTQRCSAAWSVMMEDSLGFIYARRGRGRGGGDGAAWHTMQILIEAPSHSSLTPLKEQGNTRAHALSGMDPPLATDWAACRPESERASGRMVRGTALSSWCTGAALLAFWMITASVCYA